MNAYSPGRRTAVVLCGTGAHGAYHAGVLRALQEAGVKIDLLAGHGVGAAGAALGAIDGTARLWEPDGIWRRPATTILYAWTRPMRVAGWLAVIVVALLLLPLIVVAVGLIVYPLGLLLGMLGTSAGAAIVALYSGWLENAFAGENLPTILPRLAMIAVGCLLLVLAAGAFVSLRRAPVRRRGDGRWWWRLLGAPLDADAARRLFTGTIWELIQGASPPGGPPSSALGRRYAELLVENLGQPGFREMLLVVTDLDARRDVVGALLQDPFRKEFLKPRRGGDRRPELLDLGGVDREHTADVLQAALTPPLVCEPHLITFAAGSFWRGETHRLCDRPGAAHRLLQEVARAGATQVIVVSAVAPGAAPHQLRPPRVEIRGRLGEFLVADESASLRDALEAVRDRFAAVYVICPAHNPVGPFDFSGSYDEMSDRWQDLEELMDRAYEDGYRQFVEPVVGASGDHIGRVAAEAPQHVQRGSSPPVPRSSI